MPRIKSQVRKKANVFILLQREHMMKEYIGVDVSKARLDIDWLGQAINVANTDSGIKRLIKQLKDDSAKHELGSVVLEASGGYEKNITKACHEAGIPVHVAHANKVRAYAKAKGILAKTDKIDAEVLSEYGRVMNIKGDTILLSKNAEKISLLLGRREQLMNDSQREKNRLDKINDKDIKSSVDAHVKWLDKQIKKIDEQLSECSQAEEVKSTHDLLTSVPSIGDLVANYLIARLPELGKVSHKAAAALVGVAPYNRDSGQMAGKRFIQGGRRELRRVLYMAAIVSIRCNDDMKVFYQRLKTAGKPSKVAIVAVIRKLLTVLTSVLIRQTPWQPKIEKNLNFS